jgi:serine/threonine-protein kinase
MSPKKRGKDAPAAEPAAGAPPPAKRRPFAQRLRAKLIQFTVVIVFALAAFGTGMVVFNYLLMPGLIHSKSEIKVPDVHQLSLDQAESVLGQHGLQVSRAGERFDPDVPRGFVISEDPGPGAPVRRQKTVQVVVSLGEEFSSVPALFGESRRSAEQLLKSAGLSLGRVTRAPSSDIGEGLVLASDPPAESVLPRDTPVSFLISAGAGDNAFLMPDLLGREIGRARTQLEAFGLHVRVPGVSAPIGAIVYQQPRPGAQITSRDTVVLQAMGRLIQ